MKFTMPVTKNVATKQGHTIAFEAGKPTHVPKECYKEVQAAGAVPEDQVAVQEKPAPKKEEVEGDERKMSVFSAFEQLVEANRRGDFSAQGVPKTNAVEKITGFDMDAKERDELWRDFMQKDD